MAPTRGSPIIRVSAWLLLTLIVILMGGGFALLHMGHSVFAAVLFSLLAATVTFGFLGATGIVRTKGYQIGGSAAGFLVTLMVVLQYLPGPPVIRGTLLLDGNPVKRAKLVLLRVNAPVVPQELNGEDGFFQFGEVPVVDGKIVISITLPEYEPITTTNRYKQGHPVIINLEKAMLLRSPKLTDFRVPSDLAETATYGFKNPPLLKASMVGDKGRPELTALFDKVHQALVNGKLRTVRPDEIVIRHDAKGSWSAEIDTRRIVEKEFSKLPHGNYRVEIGLQDQETPRLTSDINYVFTGDAFPPNQLLEGNTRSFTADRSGIVGSNRSRNGGFVSIRLRQAFDFRANFVVKGSFRIEPVAGTIATTAAFDVTLGDEDSDRVSVILGEDSGDGYSIKAINEGVQTRGDQSQVNKKQDSGVFVKKDGKTMHWFEIRVLKDSDPRFVWYHLYLKPTTLDLKSDAPLFSRRLHAGLLYAGATRVRLRVWGSGVVCLRDLEIAELTRANM